ncbi:HAMP domain-containing histidine kinase [Gordonia sp. TBRC 11910]|uniref:histidine kinase n=1 Tax=Gordonia asplenii TaxID=2725283 RepID=A0A848L3V8_9ACTN|nr:HAMP domain-containing sensor histidine kinase [Gordonia asplenii]NMO05227.1 HAMP domain-containing histidine kinase [Gordonia asplenii]
MTRKQSRRRRLGVRARSTLIATLAAALAFVLGGVVMLMMLHKANNDLMYRAASARTEQIAHTITQDGLAGLGVGDLDPGGDVDVVQVIDQRGAVVAATAGAPSTPMVDGATPPGDYRYTDDATFAGRPEKYCAATLGAEHDEHYYTVIAAVRAGGIRHSELTTAVILAIELPIIIAFAAWAVYLLVGRSLRPVSRISRQAREITASALEQRVPVPDAKDEIHTLATTMNDMLERLESSREAQMRFVGDASHELRSPLTTLVGLLDLADDTDSAVDIATVRTFLLPEASRMQRMVDDLLLLARADEDGLRLCHKPIDLDDLVFAESARVRALGTARVRTQVVPLRVQGDPDMIARALRNLTDNAVRHATSTVWLTMRAEHDVAVVVVSDDGPGIGAEQSQRIFERFARLDTDRRTASGAGLGLAIVSEIARAHHGHVRLIESRFGGASMEFTLPMTPGESSVVAEAVTTAANGLDR